MQTRKLCRAMILQRAGEGAELGDIIGAAFTLAREQAVKEATSTGPIERLEFSGALIEELFETGYLNTTPILDIE